jgi:hypothetical protein
VPVLTDRVETAFVIDRDDTLIDSGPSLAWQEAFGGEGLELSVPNAEVYPAVSS